MNKIIITYRKKLHKYLLKWIHTSRFIFCGVRGLFVPPSLEKRSYRNICHNFVRDKKFQLDCKFYFIIGGKHWTPLLCTHQLQIRNQEGKGQWDVYYTSPQSFIRTFSFLLVYELWRLLMNFDWLIHKVSVLKF